MSSARILPFVVRTVKRLDGFALGNLTHEGENGCLSPPVGIEDAGRPGANSPIAHTPPVARSIVSRGLAHPSVKATTVVDISSRGLYARVLEGYREER